MESFATSQPTTEVEGCKIVACSRPSSAGFRRVEFNNHPEAVVIRRLWWRKARAC
jgi:hypothetical protein